jgi:regulatory subunit for Cdc7p protein kinase
MRMKLWTVDKLQRMLNTLFDEAKDETLFGPARAARTAAVPYRRNGRDADLSQLLQKEKMTGPADRDMTVATQEMIPLRGCYVYVYDMDEKTKPVMIREYAVPSKKEEGKWPQLRSTGNGKCPFLEDPAHAKKLQQQEQENAQPGAELQEAGPRARAVSAADRTSRGLAGGEARQALAEDTAFTRNAANASKTNESAGITKPLDPPKLIPAKRRNLDSMPPMFTTAQANMSTITRYAGREPVASGVQPSNITSAIRSQVVSSFSSTAAVPGARAATSKEVHQLKRKVLEKTSGPSANSMPSSHLNDVRAAINQDRGPPPRAAKRKAQESLAGITEEMTVSEQEAAEKRLAIIRRKKTVEKDPKPGYCENCRDKFNDCDEVNFSTSHGHIGVLTILKHIMSRKHRKFAMSPSNWKELDDLLAELDRPLVHGYRTS